MAEDPSTTQPRRFSYGEAKALLPQVRSLTERACAAFEALQRELAAQPESAALRERVESVVRGWAESVTALGIEVKGLWLVDFDNGSGYYCWRWPETGLDYYHTYEDGFSGRVRIH